MRHLGLTRCAGVVFMLALANKSGHGLVSTPASVALRTAVATSASGVISGTVTDAASHGPIEGAVVRLSRLTSPGGGYELTDSRGRFVFTGLGAGSYVLNATRAGFADTGYGRVPGSSVGAQIILQDGQWFDSANIEMARVGALGGHVLDEVGEPLVGAYVRVFSRFIFNGTSHLAAGPIAQTDDRGEYRFPDLSAGQYVIVVPSPQNSLSAEVIGQASAPPRPQLGRPERLVYGPDNGLLIDQAGALVLGNYAVPPLSSDGSPQVYPLTFYPGTRLLESAGAVTLPPGGDVSNLDVTVAPVRGVRVSGKLIGANNYAGYVVRLIAPGLEELGAAGEQATSAVAPGGQFTFLNVPAGSYTLYAPGASFSVSMPTAVGASSIISLPQTPGWTLHRNEQSAAIRGASGIRFTSRLLNTIDDPQPGYAAMPVHIGTDDVSDLIVPIERSGTIVGQVRLKEPGNALSSGQVDLASASSDSTMGIRFARISETATTDRPAGTFEFGGLPAGEYLVDLSSNGLSMSAVGFNGQDVSTRPLRLEPGMTGLLEIVATNNGAIVKGTVSARSNEPAGGNMVIVFPTDRSLWGGDAWIRPWISTVITSTDGRYEKAGIRAGEYYVVAVPIAQGQKWAERSFLESVIKDSTKVTLNWGSTLSLNLGLASVGRQ